MLSASVIKYTVPLSKSIEWAKSWVETDLEKSAIDDIFDAPEFVKKYSTKPPADISYTSILLDALDDQSVYMFDVIRKIKSIGLKNEKKILKNVKKELPSGEDLADILLSYRLYDNVGKQRLRLPSVSDKTIIQWRNKKNQDKKNKLK